MDHFSDIFHCEQAKFAVDPPWILTADELEKANYNKPKNAKRWRRDWPSPPNHVRTSHTSAAGRSSTRAMNGRRRRSSVGRVHPPGKGLGFPFGCQSSQQRPCPSTGAHSLETTHNTSLQLGRLFLLLGFETSAQQTVHKHWLADARYELSREEIRGEVQLFEYLSTSLSIYS